MKSFFGSISFLLSTFLLSTTLSAGEHLDELSPFSDLGEGMKMVVNNSIPIRAGKGGVIFLNGKIVESDTIPPGYAVDSNICMLFKYYKGSSKQRSIPAGEDITFNLLTKNNAAYDEVVQVKDQDGRPFELLVPRTTTEFQEVNTLWNSEEERNKYDSSDFPPSEINDHFPHLQDQLLGNLVGQISSAIKENWIFRCDKTDSVPKTVSGRLDLKSWTYPKEPLSIFEVKQIVGSWLSFYQEKY